MHECCMQDGCSDFDRQEIVPYMVLVEEELPVEQNISLTVEEPRGIAESFNLVRETSGDPMSL